MNDDAIRRAVLEAFEADGRLSSHSISVQAQGDRITLSGCVQSFRRKLVAHELAAATAPERAIVNDLEVELPKNVSDAEVAEEVRALLEHEKGLAKHAIVVEMRAGRATLSGAVHDLSERRLAQDVALQAPGVREVANQLLIASDSLQEAEVVGAELELVLAESPDLAGCAFHLALSGHVAVLSGRAGSRFQVQHALKLVREVWAGELRDEVRIP